MLNEYAYCPRLFHLMYVEGRWADNAYTAEGRHVHRRIDRVDQLLPEATGAAASRADDSSDSTGRTGDGGDASDAADSSPKAYAEGGAGRRGRGKAKPPDDGDEPPIVVRSVPLSSERLGVTAKLDLVAIDDTPPDGGAPLAAPVETKRGRVPNNPERSWEPERVQLMAQGLLLRERGYRCDRGLLYFAGSRTRVLVPFTAELEARTLALLEQARLASTARELPPPLDDSPKCRGCSLNGICLPDETLALRHVPQDPLAREVRRLYPARDDAQPLYVQEQGAFVGKKGERLVVKKEGAEISSVPLKDLSQLVLCGNVGISAQTLHLLCEAGVPVAHLSMGHWFYGVTHGITLRNAFDRAAQFHAAARPDRCLAFARRLVADKVTNQRTLLRRNAEASSCVEAALRDLDDLQQPIAAVGSLDSLLGLEGAAAARYFGRFVDMLRPRDFDAQWDFTARNRRPPRDPVNALLSFAYALLVKECTVALLLEGLDPWWGLYHQPRHGRPALALDLMEPLRPIVADSAVLTAINTGMVTLRSFERAAGACMLNDAGRKALLRAFEARLDQLVTHPIFDYRCSWRSAIRVQARLLSRWLRGDVPEFTSLTTR
jgi:CRISPR-associated protein Cas1